MPLDIGKSTKVRIDFYKFIKSFRELCTAVISINKYILE